MGLDFVLWLFKVWSPLCWWGAEMQQLQQSVSRYRDAFLPMGIHHSGRGKAASGGS